MKNRIKNNNVYVGASEFRGYMERLMSMLKEIDWWGRFKYVYGVPRGGCMIAQWLEGKGFARACDDMESPEETLVVDDIIDSGRTRLRYKNYKFCSIHAKPEGLNYLKDSGIEHTRYVEECGCWVEYWWEQDQTIGEDCVARMIQIIGDSCNREGLAETPERVVRSWNELYSGYRRDAGDVLKWFEDGSCDEMVVLRDIEFYSMCEHHMLPFTGRISIGYIPDGRVVGVSKLARLAEIFARRLQIQERMTAEIADAIMGGLKPKGVMVTCHAKHFCMIARGVKKQNSEMVTSAIRGSFEKPEVRQEFMNLTGGV